MTEPRAGLKRGYYLLNTDGGMASNGRRRSGDPLGACPKKPVLCGPIGVLGSVDQAGSSEGVRGGDGGGEGPGGDAAGGDGLPGRVGAGGVLLPEARPLGRLVVRARGGGAVLRRGGRPSVDRPDRAGEVDARGRVGGDRLDARAVSDRWSAPGSAALPRLRLPRAPARPPDALARPDAPLR